MVYEILALKSYSSLTGIAIAKRLDNKAKLLRAAREYVVLRRMVARHAVNEYSSARQAVSEANRAMKKASEANVTFAFGESQIQKLSEDCKGKRRALVSEGYMLSAALDMWQEAGATLKDLCNLCNRDYGQVLEEVSADRRDEPFSSIVSIYTLDFKSRLDFLTCEVDAPLTHALRESVLDTMLNTPEGQVASRSALNACFPELMENVLRRYTDEDGVEHLIDKDGVEITNNELKE